MFLLAILVLACNLRIKMLHYYTITIWQFSFEKIIILLINLKSIFVWILMDCTAHLYSFFTLQFVSDFMLYRLMISSIVLNLFIELLVPYYCSDNRQTFIKIYPGYSILSRTKWRYFPCVEQMWYHRNLKFNFSLVRF